MSVKIYGGMLIEKGMELSELRILAKKARPRFDAQIEAGILGFIAATAVRAHDRSLMGFWPELLGEGQDGAATPMSIAMRSLGKEREDFKAGRNGSLDLGFEAALFAISPQKTLALGFGGRPQQELFAKIAKAKPHGYWDNSDPPEELPCAAWTQRRRDWQAALGKDFSASPAEAGVTVKLASDKYAAWWFPDSARVEQALSAPAHSTSARASRMAESLCRSIYMERMRPGGLEAAKSASEVVGLIEAWREASQAGAKPMLDLARSLLEALPAIGESGLEAGVADLEAKGASLKAMVADRLALMAVGPGEQAKPGRKPSL